MLSATTLPQSNIHTVNKNTFVMPLTTPYPMLNRNQACLTGEIAAGYCQSLSTDKNLAHQLQVVEQMGM
jgi:hypothetical protein